MIEVFTPLDSDPTAIDPHSLSNTMYINKSRGTLRATMLQYSLIPVIARNQKIARGDVGPAIVICHFHRIEAVMECVNLYIIMVAW